MPTNVSANNVEVTAPLNTSVKTNDIVISNI